MEEDNFIELLLKFLFYGFMTAMIAFAIWTVYLLFITFVAIA